MTPASGSSGACPECGLDRGARVAPRARFWTAWRAGPWALAGVLLLAVIVGSALRAKRSSYPGTGAQYPAFLGVAAGTDLTQLQRLVTINDLREAAAGRRAAGFTLEEVIAQSRDRADNRDPAAHLSVHVWYAPQGNVYVTRSFGWPRGWLTTSSSDMFDDLRTFKKPPTAAFARPARPASTSWTRWGLRIQHSATGMSSAETSVSHFNAAVVLTAGVLAAWVAALVVRRVMGRRGRDEGTAARRGFRAGVIAFLLVLGLGLGLPRRWEMVYAYSYIGRGLDTGLTLADLEAMRGDPAAQKGLAEAFLQQIDAAPLTSDEQSCVKLADDHMKRAAQERTGGDEESARDFERLGSDPMLQIRQPNHVVLISFSDASASTVEYTSIGWPLPLVSIQTNYRDTAAGVTDYPSSGWRVERVHNGDPSSVVLVRDVNGSTHLVRRVLFQSMSIAGVLGLIGLIPGLMAGGRAVYVHVRTSRRRKRGRCVGCGYDLAGLPSPMARASS